MVEIKEDKKIDKYIKKYKLDEIFSVDMKPYMKLFKINKGEYICRANEKMDKLFFLVEGKAKVYISLENGKSLLLTFNKPLEVIGDIECVKLDKSDSNIEVIEESYCVAIDFKDIRKYAINDSKFLIYMIESLGKKLSRSSKHSSINLLYPLENRLSSYLLATSVKKSNEDFRLVTECNLIEMSELLGCSYRHLLRTLKSLSEMGAIKKSGYFYEIVNKEILENLASDLYDE